MSHFQKPPRRSTRFDANPNRESSFSSSRHMPDPKTPPFPPPSAPPSPPKRDLTARSASTVNTDTHGNGSRTTSPTLGASSNHGGDSRRDRHAESISSSVRKNIDIKTKSDPSKVSRSSTTVWGDSVFRGNDSMKSKTGDGVSFAELCKLKSCILLVLKLLRDKELTIRLKGSGSVSDVPHLDVVSYRYIWREVLAATTASMLQPFIAAIKHAESMAEYCTDAETTNDNTIPTIKRIRTAEPRPEGPPIEKAIQRDCQLLVKLDNSSRNDLILTLKKWTDLSLSEYQKHRILQLEKGMKRTLDPVIYKEIATQESVASFLLDPLDGDFDNWEMGESWLRDMTHKFQAIGAGVVQPVKKEVVSKPKIEDAQTKKTKTEEFNKDQLHNNGLRNGQNARKRPLPRRNV